MGQTLHEGTPVFLNQVLIGKIFLVLQTPLLEDVTKMVASTGHLLEAHLEHQMLLILL